jgi:hypothetical protein
MKVLDRPIGEVQIGWMARKLLSNAMWKQLAAALAEVKPVRGAPPGLERPGVS